MADPSLSTGASGKPGVPGPGNAPHRFRVFASAEMRIAGVIALAVIIIHLLTAGRYGYFRDELYYMACGDHLAVGYVDFAPMTAFVVRLSRSLFGDSLYSIRLFPALAHAGEILLTGLIAREFGGRRFAVGLACLCVLVAPVILGTQSILATNNFEPLCWMGCVYVLALVIRRKEPKLLIWFGVLAGLGLENKHSMVFFGFALVVALLLTPYRGLFASKWMWIAAAIALLIFLPNLIWQYQHHWATYEDLHNVKVTHKNVELPPGPFLLAQLMMLNPLTVLVWLPGLGFLLFGKGARSYRVFGLAYLVLLATMMALKGKDYYLAPAYPMLFAAGAVFWETLADSKRGLSALKPVVAGIVVVAGVISAPFAIPVLSVPGFLAYEDKLGIHPPKTEVNHEGPLPQFYGDRFGWPEMVAKVADIYHALPPEEQKTAGILAGNYGEAGAIDFFGPRYGLPKAISGHQTYFYWGPRNYTGDVLILLQWSREGAERHCDNIQDAGALDPPYGMGEEHYTIYVCRGFHPPLQTFWPKIKHWN